MLEKIKSRKFILACVSGLLVVCNSGLDLGLPEDSILAVAGIVAAYIVGQGVVDAASAKGGE